MVAITIVVAQCLLLIHDTDIAKHSSGHVCEFCLQASSVGSPHIAPDPVLYTATAITFTIAIYLYTFILPISRRPIQARAPPALL